MFNKLKPYVKLLFIPLFIIGLGNCNLDNPDDVCGESFSESEFNGSIDHANHFNIILKKDCTVTITGSITNSSDTIDYIRFNTGDTSSYKIQVIFTNTTYDLDISLTNEYGVSIVRSSGNGTIELINHTTTDQFYPRFIRIEQVPLGTEVGSANYTIAIEGS